ncbi:MAG: PQQ-dependent sugar dehydrogenase [Nitrososphaera sp.]
MAAASLIFALLADPGADSISAQKKSGRKVPVMHDDNLDIELVAEGLKFPTSMSFLDNDNILVLQKNDGQVRLVSDGQLAAKPILQTEVASEAEQGLLGIAVHHDNATEAFIYLTENATGAAKNRIFKYAYDWNKKSLVNGTLLLDISGGPGPYHNGGKVKVGPDGYLYAITGDTTDSWSLLDNEKEGVAPDNRSTVTRINRETGEAAPDNPFHEAGLEKVYAYGIRNSFGMDFDPVTGTLWVTENGPDKYDEINVVQPGFDSGWDRFTGPIARSNATAADLVMLDGAHYADPAFSWQLPVGVTDIEFFASDRLGEKYRNNVFVGDINNGNIYFFQVNQDRTGLQLGGDLADLVADMFVGSSGIIRTEATQLVIGEGFGRITDIETGPDGYLYVLTYEDGRIYRIT